MQAVVLLVACIIGIGLPNFAYGVPDDTHDENEYNETGTEYTDSSSSTPKRVTTAVNDQEPQDSALTCGLPLEIDKAYVSGAKKKAYSVGSRVEYVCDFGFVAEGVDKSSRCLLAEGDERPKWTVPQITCVPRSCGDPGYVTHARRVGSLFTFPNKVSFECGEGYELRGSPNRYCQTNGKWSGRLPTCTLVSCDPPRDIENGRATYSSLEYGSELEYECEKGYKLSSRQIRVCSADGEWTGDTPTCEEAHCGHPVAPENGKLSIIGDQIIAGSLATYSCNDGLVLRGSNVTKCLDTGEWTFPTPECLKPCVIPEIWKGVIGTYQPRNRGSSYLKPIQVGTLLKDDESLFLVCSDGYKPYGISDYQVRVSCDRGKWSHTLRCESASCNQDPPATMNARISHARRDHRGTVTYECDRGFTKTEFGNVTCRYGEWKGITPICTSKQCSVDSLTFDGFVRPKKVYYTNGEFFVPSCSNGYTVARPQNSMIRCRNGEWDGHLPPCVGESCSDPPPSPPHGRVQTYGKLHASIVNYECEVYFLLQENSKVTCWFGEWVGQLPTCFDSRCYARDLNQKKGVAIESIPVTYSRYPMDVRCFEGYHVGYEKPVCIDGKWTEQSLSPCIEDLCAVPYINYGGITVKDTVRGEYVWYKLSHKKVLVYKKIQINSRPNRHAELYISCQDGYSVHGKGENHVRVVCEEGRWRPNPVCQITGTPYQEDFIAREGSIMTTKITQEQNPNIITTEATPSTIFNSAQPSLPTSIHGRIETSEQNICNCVFPVENKLLQAYVGNKKIGLGSQVHKGDIVKFHCSVVGFYRLVGESKLKCEDCRKWHSSEVPDCVGPRKGDGVIYFDAAFNVSSDGVLEIQKGHTGRLTCLSHQFAFYPVWKEPAGSNVRKISATEVQGSGTFYVSTVDIVNASSNHAGKYVCNGRNSDANTVELRVVDSDQLRIPCPAFETENEMKVEYHVFTEVTASFSCKHDNRKLEGKRTLTCLESGSWSDEPPKCIVKLTCPELKGNENMAISYSNGLDIGSIAAFHCFKPGIRSGVPHTKCLENGQWKDEQASCSLSRCLMDTLFSIVPKGVTPSMDGLNSDSVPYGTTLRLMCEKGMASSGDPEAKCGNEGLWEVATLHCEPGCPGFRRATDPRLQIEPEQEVYEFGQFVAFSCPEGLSLTSEMEKIVCLNNGWSDSTIPNCTKL